MLKGANYFPLFNLLHVVISDGVRLESLLFIINAANQMHAMLPLNI